MEDLYFEIFDSDSFVRVEPIEMIQYDSDADWDKNWIRVKVTLKAGAFSGQYLGDFLTINFEKFKQQFDFLYDDLSGNANFTDLEGYLLFQIQGDGIGHFEVNIEACDKPGIEGSELAFKLSFDQTQIKKISYQLDRITKAFPVVGNLWS